MAYHLYHTTTLGMYPLLAYRSNNTHPHDHIIFLTGATFVGVVAAGPDDTVAVALYRTNRRILLGGPCSDELL